MLSSSFLPAKQLGIPENFRLALIEFHRRAASGEIPDILFDIRFIGEPECGSPGCILGWVKAIDPEALRSFNQLAFEGSCNQPLPPWHGLFSSSARHTTPAQAAEAVFSFLTTGKGR